MTLPQVEGFEMNVGSDLGGKYDFPCAASSVAETCMIMGPAPEAGDFCASDAQCQGFVFFPEGVAFDGSGPVSILKATTTLGQGLDAADMQMNPTAATYLKSAESSSGTVSETGDIASSGGGGGNDTTVIVAVVSSVVGVAVVVVAVGAVVVMHIQYRKMSSGANGSDQGGGGAKSDGPQLTSSLSGGSSASSGVDGPSSSSSSSITTTTTNSSDGDGRHDDKIYLERRNSPPSVVDVNSGGNLSCRAALFTPFYGAAGGATSGGHDVMNVGTAVIVSELQPATTASGNIPSFSSIVISSNNSSGGSGGGRANVQRGMPPGSSARELLEAFSQMYAHRPRVDYDNLAEMLEGEEAVAAAAREEAQEETSRAAERSNDNSDNESNIGVVQLPGVANGTSTATTTTSSSSNDSSGWSIHPEDVEVCRRGDGSWWQLGTGAFGTVYKGTYQSSVSVAIKVLHRLEEQRHSDAFAREILLIKTLRDRHVVQFLGACLDGPQGTAMLITELMELGDLWRALPTVDKSGQRIFGWYNRGRRVMEDVARGLRYLHSKRIVHFDLKSANILLSRAGTAKLADIGMARVLNKSYLSMVSSGLGTFAWSAPEVLTGRRCDCKADIYSWGVVLWEVCTGEAPVRGVLRPLQVPEDCPAEVEALYRRCMSETPEERPSAAEIVEIFETSLP